jgi:hypothetical protein
MGVVVVVATVHQLPFESSCPSHVKLALQKEHTCKFCEILNLGDTYNRIPKSLVRILVEDFFFPIELNFSRKKLFSLSTTSDTSQIWQNRLMLFMQVSFHKPKEAS